MRVLGVVLLAALAAVAASVASPRSAAAPAAACKVPAHAPGWEAIFGYRSSQTAALGLRRRAERVGFKHLTVERVGCPRWAVALHGLRDRAQARELAAEAKR